MILTHIVTPEQDGLTLQQLMRGPLALSGRQARDVKHHGGVSVDGRPFFSNQPVRAGMCVRLELVGYDASDAETLSLPPVHVLYEDDALIAVHKPALLQCHPSPSAPGLSDTLEARVQSQIRQPAHPVHRLDAETTGIVLFAKLPFAQAHLQQQMQAGSVHKTYHALVFGVPANGEGLIDAPIARIEPDSFTRVVREDGQRAVSRYTCLRSRTLSEGCSVSLMELSPLTGRTHQLRVHMTHIGCPLLGDARYFTPESQSLSQRLQLSYHQLCAVELSFDHPVTGRRIAIQTQAPFTLDGLHI